MLDDFGNELENTESKIDSTMKKMAKVLHMNNGMTLQLKEEIIVPRKFNEISLFFSPSLNFSDKRQWMAIGILSLILFLVIILFIIL